MNYSYNYTTGVVYATAPTLITNNRNCENMQYRCIAWNVSSAAAKECTVWKVSEAADSVNDSNDPVNKITADYSIYMAGNVYATAPAEIAIAQISYMTDANIFTMAAANIAANYSSNGMQSEYKDAAGNFYATDFA